VRPPLFAHSMGAGGRKGARITGVKWRRGGRNGQNGGEITEITPAQRGKSGREQVLDPVKLSALPCRNYAHARVLDQFKPRVCQLNGRGLLQAFDPSGL